MVIRSLYTWSHCILRTFSASMRQLLSLCSYKSGGDCGSERASNLPQVTQLASGGPEIWTQAYMSLAACFMPCWFGVCSVTQSCLTLCDPMAYSPPGSSAVLPTTSFYLFHSVPLCLSLRNSSVFHKRPWEFPGGPVARILCMRAKGLVSILGWGTKILEAVQCGPKKWINKIKWTAKNFFN